MRQAARWLAVATPGFNGLASLLTPFPDPVYFQRRFNLPGPIFSVLKPLAVSGLALTLFDGLLRGKEVQPFFAAPGLFGLCFYGIGISFYPNIIPPGLTVAEVAAPDASLRFALVGAVVLVPMFPACTASACWVFRGKVDPDAGCH